MTTSFDPGNQEDSLALEIESEANAPDAISRSKPQFLHIRVAGAFESMGARLAKVGAELVG